MSKEKSLSSVIGNIKRTYPTNDFNPYKAMDLVYETCLAGGIGSVVCLIGYTDRFCRDLIPAWHHVLASRGLLKAGQQIPLPISGESPTHTGSLLRFTKLTNSADNQVKLVTAIKQSQITLLCSPYTNAGLKQVISHCANENKIYRVWDNNPPKKDSNKG